jgi:serine/threonine-protein kinase RsbT
MLEPIPDGDVEWCVPVASVNDIVTARLQGRKLAESVGFSASEATLVATAISELARNIVQYAGKGDILLRSATNGSRRGVVLIARDQGPGIGDVKLALRSGYSTSGGLGLGLPGVRRIVDDFQIVSERRVGTTITATKWKN